MARTMGAERRFDPLLEGPHPELRPPDFAWVHAVPPEYHLSVIKLSSRFLPLLIVGSELYGIFEEDTGERVIARASIPQRTLAHE